MSGAARGAVPLSVGSVGVATPALMPVREQVSNDFPNPVAAVDLTGWDKYGTSTLARISNDPDLGTCGECSGASPFVYSGTVVGSRAAATPGAVAYASARVKSVQNITAWQLWVGFLNSSGVALAGSDGAGRAVATVTAPNGSVRRLEGFLAVPVGAAFMYAWVQPYGSGTTQPDPARCAALTTALATALRQVKPGLTIIGPGISCGGTTDATAKTMTSATFLAQFLAAGGAQSLNGLSLHPYGAANAVGSHYQSAALLGVSAAIDEARSALTTAGLARPLWTTEMGWKTDGTAQSESQQAQALAFSFSLFERDTGIASLGFHTLVSETLDFATTNQFWEIVETPSLRRKPAFAALAQARRRAKAPTYP